MSGFAILVLGICLLVFYYLFAVRINKGMTPTPFFITAMSMLLLNLIGSLFIAIGWTDRPFKELEDEYGFELFLYVFASSLLFLFAANMISRMKIKQISIKGQDEPKFQRSLSVFVFLMGVLGTIIFFMYLQMLPNIPILTVLFNSDNQLSNSVLRSLATAGFDGKYWRYNMAMSYLLPFVSWYFLVRISKGNLTFFHVASYILFTCLSVFAAVVTLQKSPVIIYVVISYLVFLSVKKKKLKTKNVVSIVIAVVIIIPLTYVYFMGVKGYGFLDTLSLGVNRMFVGQVYPVLYYLDGIPSYFDYFMGKSMPNPGGIFDYVPVSVSSELWSLYFPDLASQGISGTVNTVYIMEGYANFGQLGIFLFAIISGFLVMWISRFLEGITLTEIRVPLTFMVAVQFMKLSITDFSQVFLNLSMAILVCLVVFVVFLSQIVSKTKSSI